MDLLEDSAPPSDAKHILVVEDNPDHAELIVRALGGNMPAVCIDLVRTIEEARRWLAQGQPDLLFLDNRLPDGDGLDLLAGIASEREYPIVILSGQGNEIIAAQSIKDGAEDYIVKSAASLQNIDQVARRALAAWETRRKLAETERRLRESEARYKQTVDGVNDGIWEMDAVNDTYFISSGWYRQLGYQENEFSGIVEIWEAVVPPEERANSEALWMTAMNDPECRFLDLEYRVRTKSGAMKWIYIRAQLTRGPDGKLQRILATTTDITERKAVEAALAEAKAEADRANLAKSRFLAAASHDLRQPLHSLGLFLGALQNLDLTDAARGIANKMDRALQGANELLESVLDISMLEAGVVKPDFRDFNVTEVLEQIEIEFAPLAQQRNLRLNVVGSSLWLRSDPVLLLDLMRNLVSNALRYTREGRILVGVRREGAQVRIEVLDTGIGIAAEKRDRIFDEFHQLGAGARNRDEGVGLGLAIVKRLSSLLDHRILVQSTRGRGSAFGILVPRAAPPQHLLAVTTAKPRDRKLSLAGSRILVIDDDPTVREATQHLLESWGHISLAAGSLREARRKLQKGRFIPNVIIADFHIEDDVSGFDVVADIRVRLQRTIPAIVISADSRLQPSAETEGRKIWVTPKPAKPARLRALVDYILEIEGMPEKSAASAERWPAS